MDKIKDKISSFVELHAAEQVQFVINLCNQNSYTFNKNGTDRVAEILLKRLNGCLPAHEIIEQSAIGNHHLLRTRPSSKAIYLLGHMDTVFPPAHPFQKCQLKGDHLFGPGTGDMKGGLAVMVYALLALKEVELLDRLNLTVILNSDEENGSVTSRSIFLQEQPKAIACLVAECAGLNNEVVVSRNGKMGARMDCFGQDRHVGFGTHEKASAILELAHKIIEIEALNASSTGVSINAGKIEGGLGPATVPAHAYCLLDIRWEREEQKERLLKQIQDRISHHNQPGCHSKIEIQNARPAMPFTDASREILQLLQKAGLELGQEIKSQHRRGTSDANFFGTAGVPTLDGLGPICEKDHTSDEFIHVSSLKDRTALLALFLIKFGQKSGMFH